MNTPRTTHRPLTLSVGVAALVLLLPPLSAANADDPTSVKSARPSDSSRAIDPTTDNNGARDDAQAVLESFGLSPHQARWLTIEESRLRGDLDELRRLERQYRQAHASLGRELQRATRLRSRVVQARDQVDQLNELLDGGGLSSQRYNAVVDEVNRRADFINQHVALVASPLGAVIEPAVARQALQLVEHHGRLAALLARSEHTLDNLADQYDELLVNPAVEGALDSLDPKGKLGPAGDYAAERRRLARLAESLWSSQLPLAIVDNEPLLPVVLAEKEYGVFALSQEQGFSLISSELAEAVGAELDTAAKPSRLQAFGASDYKLYPATVERIRLGRHTARDVSFMVLPPEASDVTSVLDLGLLDGLDVQLDLPALTARVRDLPAGDVPAVDETAGDSENP